ncbi:MAG: hypothetical protein OET79_10630, partial [Nitrospirota bacterium]|nr:hypothetical protein [Nitrospirota bacterium]
MIEIVPCQGDFALALDRSPLQLGTEALDFGTDGGAAGQEQRQEADTAVVPGRIEIAVQQPLGERTEASMTEIHDQEGEVVEGVDRRQRLIEFETVEQNRLTIEQDDVAEMQIAVAVAHMALLPPPLQQLTTTIQLGEAGPI